MPVQTIEHKKVTGGSKKDQVVIPAAKESERRYLTPEEAAKFLSEAGWQQQGRNAHGEQLWSDPAGATGGFHGEEVYVGTVPQVDGSEAAPVKQVRCPPPAWNYPTYEAVSIEQSRDNVAKKVA